VFWRKKGVDVGKLVVGERLAEGFEPVKASEDGGAGVLDCGDAVGEAGGEDGPEVFGHVPRWEVRGVVAEGAAVSRAGGSGGFDHGRFRDGSVHGKAVKSFAAALFGSTAGFWSGVDHVFAIEEASPLNEGYRHDICYGDELR